MKHLFLIFAFLILITSCSDNTKKEVDNEKTCITIDDCEAGQICLNNICKTDDTQQNCTSSAQCLNGYYCNANGLCQERICTLNSDCLENQKCENQKCVDKGCTTNTECGIGYKCTNYECVLINEEDCRLVGCTQANYVCNQTSGICEPNEYCASNDECIIGFKCNLQTGICEESTVECVIDSDCSNGEKCLNNECIANSGCSTDNDCPTDKKACNTLTGICYECLSNSYCTNGETCDMGSRTCVNVTNPCLGVTCSNHGTCVNSNGSPVCNCNSGYTASGLNCIIETNPQFSNNNFSLWTSDILATNWGESNSKVTVSKDLTGTNQPSIHLATEEANVSNVAGLESDEIITNSNIPQSITFDMKGSGKMTVNIVCGSNIKIFNLDDSETDKSFEATMVSNDYNAFYSTNWEQYSVIIGSELDDSWVLASCKIQFRLGKTTNTNKPTLKFDASIDNVIVNY